MLLCCSSRGDGTAIPADEGFKVGECSVEILLRRVGDRP